jgi:hypothetical protein
VLSFATPPQTIPAGTPSLAMRLTLLSSTGQPQTARTDLAVTLGSSSPAGTFSTSPTGPWSPTLALTIAAGAGTSPDFYYLDTRAGTQLLTASAAGVTAGTQSVTVTPGALASLVVSPMSAMVRTRATVSVTAAGKDSYGNTLPVSAILSLTPPIYGKLAPRTGPATTLTTLRATGQASVTATVGALSATAAVRVDPSRLRIASITYRPRSRFALVTVNAVDSVGRPISRAAVSVPRPAGRSSLPHGRAKPAPRARPSFACQCEPAAATRRRFGECPRPASSGTAAPPAIGSADGAKNSVQNDHPSTGAPSSAPRRHGCSF